MTPEVTVERQFRFLCSCGATMVSGEKTVTCAGCGANLGIRRVRRQRQQRDSVAYYGSRTLPVRRVERVRQNLDTASPMTRILREPVPHRPTPRQPVVSGAKENSDNRTPLTWWQRFLKRHFIDDYPYSDSD
jgi:hypothetical protein